MVTKVFVSTDTELYSAWQMEKGIISIVVPDVGEIRMTLAKAEDLAESLARQASYGRNLRNPK